MLNKLTFFLTLLFLSLFIGKINAQTNNPHYFSERFVVQALLNLSAAEGIYQAVISNGNYGSLNDLRQANFIDSALASGDKYGYTFTLTVTDRTASTPAKFFATATPRSYLKTGRRSFYIDNNGEMRGANKTGAAATFSDPIIDSCVETKFSNEKCTIQDLRTLHGAEITYQASVGNGNFGTFQQLYSAGLISQNNFVTSHGYLFTGSFTDSAVGHPATLKLWARPTNYGVTGIKSFFIDESGVLRGVDKNGAPANENDPPIDD